MSHKNCYNEDKKTKGNYTDADKGTARITFFCCKKSLEKCE